VNVRLAFLKKMAEESPDDPFFPYALAMEHQAMGDDLHSLVLLSEVIHKFPDYIPAYHLSAQLLIKTNQDEAAVNLLNTGIMLSQKAGNKKACSEMQALLEELDS
jgi:coproporphyrinogen III oxidase